MAKKTNQRRIENENYWEPNREVRCCRRDKPRGRMWSERRSELRRLE